MHRFIPISFAGLILAAGAFAQSADNWRENWNKAKFGRSSAFTEKRAGDTRRNVVAASESSSWQEQWFQAKFGRHTAAEEARQRDEQIQTAYREERPASVREPVPYRRNEYLEQWYKAKFGRFSPMEEARGKGQK